MKERNIIFFDGQCNLCDRFIRFVFKRDFKRQFLYAPLQGQTAEKLLRKEDIQALKSIIFFKKGLPLRESQAIQAIMSQLYPRGAVLFSVLPAFLFNFFYRFIAKRRYDFFGKKTSLYKPSKEQREFFLP